MPNYTKVQFLAWEVYTGPIYNDFYNAIGYPGVVLRDFRTLTGLYWQALSQCLDVEARVAFTRRAIETAYQHADQDENTLKVFVAPEFLYRGPAGAYFHDLLAGWDGPSPYTAALPQPLKKLWGDEMPAPFNKDWRGLLGGLRGLADDERYKDWLFVFGTAIGGAYSGGPGDWKDGVAVNVACVQRGGAGRGAECCYTEKHLKSSIDFINFNYEHPDLLSMVHGNTRHDSEPDWKILDRIIDEDDADEEEDEEDEGEEETLSRPGGALFRMPSICKGDGTMVQFGLEICLDHLQGYVPADPHVQATGRLAGAHAFVDLQIVPSCGMHLIGTSLALGPEEGPREHSYALNCDGLCSLTRQAQLGGHVQLWNEVAGPGGYVPGCVSQTPDSFLDPDQTGQPDDPAKSMHFAVDGSDLDLTGRVPMEADAQRALGIDLEHISPCTLWRSHRDFAPGKDTHMRRWPMGPGFVRRLPAVPLG